MISARSVKDRLKQQAAAEGKTMQEKLILYGLERTIYRISISEYSSRFTLKGGIFLYALFDGEYARATMDIDLLAQHIPNDADKMKRIFQDIFSISCDDAVVFDLNSLRVINITEFKEYHGVNVSIMGYLDRTRVPVSIDIGFGDVIYPDRVKMDFPVLLNMEIPNVFMYSMYSAVAEKFEAFVSLGLANSRYKDYYDIYALAIHNNMDGHELKRAIKETFDHRGTSFEEIVVFEPGFAEDTMQVTRWKAFLKKKRVMRYVDFPEVIDLIFKLLSPIVDAINQDIVFDKNWDKNLRMWK